MLVAELQAKGRPLVLVERPDPHPGPGEVRIRVDACGVCGSDLFLQRGGFKDSPMPIIPGHEAAGTIDELGPGISNFKLGDQVAIYYIDAPADTHFAKIGRSNIGPDVRRMGVDVDGAFAEFVVRPVATLIVPPVRIDPVILAVLTDAVATPYHALVRIANLQAGETLVVLGVGGVGSNAVQIGRYLGARVIAVGRSPEKLKLAEELGADLLLVNGPDIEDEIRSATGGQGPDVVIQCVGSGALDELAIKIAGWLGRVVLVGTSTETFRAEASSLVWRELTVLGSRGFLPEDIREVVDLYLDGVLVTEHLTGNRRPLAQVNEALEDLASGRVLRTVLLP